MNKQRQPIDVKRSLTETRDIRGRKCPDPSAIEALRDAFLTERRLRLLAWRSGDSIADFTQCRAAFRALQMKAFNERNS